MSIKNFIKEKFPTCFYILKKVKQLNIVDILFKPFTFCYLGKYLHIAYSFYKKPKLLKRVNALYMAKRITLDKLLDDKSIAIVGNAESLLDKDYGQEIDSHDIVIRINRAKILNPEAQGNKTNIWATSFSYDLPLDMTPLYTFWIYPFIYDSEYVNPEKDKIKGSLILFKFKNWYDLYKDLGASPTTGLSLIKMIISNSSPKKIDLYGFDFFKTHNMYEKKDIKVTGHRFDLEKEYITLLLKKYNNMTLKV